ncbi:MAG: HD domain-containing protein [Acidobacteria bacterium]|nr:HD domain-containing protein [Acidobacteriota bacterium]
MQNSSNLSPIARAYVTSVVALGAATLSYSIRHLYLEPIGSQWFIIALLTLLTGSFTVKIPSTNASLSVSETFVFAAVLLFGPAAGAVTVLLECLTILFWMTSDGRSIQRILFNMAAPAIAIFASGSMFYWLSGIAPYSERATSLHGLFLPLVVFVIAYFLLNSWLVAIALGFETGCSPFQLWWTHFTWLSVNYFSGASVAALIVTYSNELDFSTLALIVPLLVISYLTFRTAMGRVEDGILHLSELNRLYLSTIETLAMAIDAKDQVTHGHIRRVQNYAIHLARHVGITDAMLIKAIEAAALLHDMGKLAVPEYILNKPGKLSKVEFERMKLHASVGADILSSINFPYPVVPIVRHHHENWDGSGYPDGMKGTDIPVGARILAVADCFDALTSDRPYRPRVSHEEALNILNQRRGSMYDPLVVDAFSEIHAVFAPSTSLVALHHPAPVEITTTSANHGRLIPARADLHSATHAVMPVSVLQRRRSSADQAMVAIVEHLSASTPVDLCVYYRYDPATDELEAEHCVGSSKLSFKGLRIPLGQRLSGWVAAHRQRIINSDPVLDLGTSLANGLRTSVSVPLVVDRQLCGVLSVYSASEIGFSNAQCTSLELLLERIAPQLVTGEKSISIVARRSATLRD